VLELGRQLSQELTAARVRVEVPDRDTVLFRNVPTDGAGRHFNKPQTNLLVKRAREGLPFLVCVDEDLTYLGEDPALARAFAAGPARQGWRALCLGRGPQGDFEAAVRQGLGVLGFGGRQPALAAGRTGPELLEKLGVDLSRLAREGGGEPTAGRREEVEQVTACLLRWGQARLPLIVGESGVGKSNLLHAIARRLAGCRPAAAILCVDLPRALAGTLFEAEREDLVAALLSEVAAAPGRVLALERLECAVAEVPHGSALLTHALDNGLRLVGTTLPGMEHAIVRGPLGRRVQVVTLAEPTAAETAEALRLLRPRIAAHHGVEIDESLLAVTVKAARPLHGCMPARAVLVLDEAASRAALCGAQEVSPDDILCAARSCAGG